MFGLNDNDTFFLLLGGLLVGLGLAALLTSKANPENVQNVDKSTTLQPGHAAWWFFKLLESDIHTMLVAKTRSGKSYLARAMVAGFSQMGHKVLIIDPHAKADDWPGLPVVGRGKKYSEIELTLEKLIEEADRRFDMWGRVPDYNPEPLEVFIDEARSISSHCISAGEVFTDGSSEWAKIKIRIHLLTQSMLVESLKGFKGQGDLRENYNMVFLKNQALAKAPYLAPMTRPALLELDGHSYPIDTTWLTSYLQTTPVNLQMLEGVLQVPGKSLQVPVSSSENQPAFELKTTARTSELDLIKALLKGGLTPTQVVETLGGNRQKRFEQVNQISKELQEIIK